MTRPPHGRQWNSSSAIRTRQTCPIGSTSSTSPPPTTEPSTPSASCAPEIPRARSTTPLNHDSTHYQHTKKMIKMSDTQRLNVLAVDKAAYQPMIAMEEYIHGGSLGEELLALIKLRASQLNGCAYCLNMHAREARKAEVDQVKVDVLAGWKEAASVYSSREQAALRLTEAVTLIAGGVSDETWEAASADFSEQEMVELLMAISAINVWNRLAVSTHQPLDCLAPVTWRLADGRPAASKPLLRADT